MPLALTSIGAGGVQNVLVTQSSYSGGFTESDNCSASVTIAVQTNTSGSAVYSFTPVALGTCSATFQGALGKSQVLPVSVSTSGFGINISRGRAR